MPNTYIRDGGVWKAVTQPYVNQSGTNTPVKAIYVRDGGVWKIAYPDYTLSYLVIAGGGGGGFWQDSVGNGAGAGAGGLLQGTGTLTRGQVYTATVGTGGSPRVNGGNSSLTGTGLSIPTAIGGGAGGGPTESGNSGGSGGGGAGYRFGSTSGGSGTAGQGFAGGSAPGGGGSPGSGGGGGAGGPGGNSNGQNDYGAGGIGVESSITGTPTYYAGGGQIAQGSGGLGYLNFGGGGSGGAGGSSPTSGQNGAVIIRIPTVYYTGLVTGSTVVTTVGNDTVITFTGSGTYTA